MSAASPHVVDTMQNPMTTIAAIMITWTPLGRATQPDRRQATAATAEQRSSSSSSPAFSANMATIAWESAFWGCTLGRSSSTPHRPRQGRLRRR
jgi:hypothetical protein